MDSVIPSDLLCDGRSPTVHSLPGGQTPCSHYERHADRLVHVLPCPGYVCEPGADTFRCTKTFDRKNNSTSDGVKDIPKPVGVLRERKDTGKAAADDKGKAPKDSDTFDG